MVSSISESNSRDVFSTHGLAARNKELAINETKHLFVEFKLDLKTNFDHSFEKLEAIICWNSRVKDGDSMTDLAVLRVPTVFHLMKKEGRSALSWYKAAQTM